MKESIVFMKERTMSAKDMKMQKVVDLITSEMLKSL
jgi:hypothetical protein